MSITVNFTSGKSFDMDAEEGARFVRNIRMRGGLRYHQTNEGHIIPLNSQTIEFIEITNDDEQKAQTRAEIIAEETPIAPKVIEPELEQTEPVEKPKKTQDELLAEMVDKSNCSHEKEKLEVKCTNTKNGKRYFPVCSYCGHRGRFIGKQKVAEGRDENWTIEDLQGATEYQEK